MCVFENFPGQFMSIFHVFPGLFIRVDIELEQVRFSHTIISMYHTKSITLCTQFDLSVESNQNVESKQKSVEFRNEKCGVQNFSKHVHGSEMRQPFGLYSMTFQNLGLIPWLSRPGKFEFQIQWLSHICAHPVNGTICVKHFKKTRLQQFTKILFRRTQPNPKKLRKNWLLEEKSNLSSCHSTWWRICCRQLWSTTADILRRWMLHQLWSTGAHRHQWCLYVTRWHWRLAAPAVGSRLSIAARKPPVNVTV